VARQQAGLPLAKARQGRGVARAAAGRDCRGEGCPLARTGQGGQRPRPGRPSGPCAAALRARAI